MLRLRKPSQGQVVAQPAQQWAVSYLLHLCMWNTGTRYLIAKEVEWRSVNFGTTNTMNGTQWVAAAEAALRRNGLLLIRVRPNLVQVIPANKLEEYRKAGWVKTGSPD